MIGLVLVGLGFRPGFLFKVTISLSETGLVTGAYGLRFFVVALVEGRVLEAYVGTVSEVSIGSTGSGSLGV